MSPLSVNRNALPFVKELVQKSKELGVEVTKMSNGTTIIDVGSKTRGGFQAGRLVTKICLGGYGQVQLSHADFGGLDLPTIHVFTDHPALSTLGSQLSGWAIRVGDYFALGSGPARALALKPRELYERINYRDESDVAILMLESSEGPTDEVAEHIAGDCGVKPGGLYLILTPTSSVAGSVQISGRIVETGIHKLTELDFDPKRILYASGYAPIAPIHPKFEEAMGRTNDMVLYGGTAGYIVDHDSDEELRSIVNEAPSSASKDYGRPFSEIFEKADRDFYKIDPGLFAPAFISLTNVRSGKTFSAGGVNVDIIKKSIGL